LYACESRTNFDTIINRQQKGTAKKRRRENTKERKETIMSGEKSEREEKMDKCFTGQKNPSLRKKA
jgi:hypothetical protein